MLIKNPPGGRLANHCKNWTFFQSLYFFKKFPMKDNKLKQKHPKRTNYDFF